MYFLEADIEGYSLVTEINNRTAYAIAIGWCQVLLTRKSIEIYTSFIKISISLLERMIAITNEGFPEGEI